MLKRRITFYFDRHSGVNLMEIEQELGVFAVTHALKEAKGNHSHAARLCGVSRTTFLYRLELYRRVGLVPAEGRDLDS